MIVRTAARAIARNVALALCLLVAPAIAQAHALLAEAKLERGKVVVAAQYDDGDPAINAKVFLVHEKGEKVLRGKTDSEGELRFDVPRPGQYEIVVDAGAGHLAKVSVTITDAMQPGASPPPDPIRLGKGQTIEEAQGNRWLKIAIGLVAILALASLLKLLSRRKSSPSAAPPGG